MNISFGAALETLMAGAKIQRAGWNGKGMWLALVPADQWGLGSGQQYDSGHIGSRLNPWIGMKAADGSFFPWNPNNLDLLAEDWRIVE